MNIITSKTRSRWRAKEGSRYHGAKRREVEERAREVARQPGVTLAEVQMAVREMTAYDDPRRGWENMQAGVIAGQEEWEKDAAQITEKAPDSNSED